MMQSSMVWFVVCRNLIENIDHSIVIQYYILVIPRTKKKKNLYFDTRSKTYFYILYTHYANMKENTNAYMYII